MTDPVVSNILKTGATVYKAPLGTTLPDVDTVLAGGAWPAGWEKMGLTKTPLAIKYEATPADIKVEEFLMPVGRKKVEEKASLEVTFAEFTAANLALGMGGTPEVVVASAATVGSETLAVGNDSHLIYEMWAFEGVRYDDDDAALPVRFYVYRATSTLNGDLEFTKKGDDYTGIALKIEALADATKAGKWGLWERVTAPKTA